MQKILKLTKTQIAGVLMLLCGLVAVRIFQEHLFYDPLIAFFKSESRTLPAFNPLRLFYGLAFRYLLNTFLSLCMLWIIFKSLSVVKLSAILYLLFFIILSIAFFIVINNNASNLLLLFYIRRFLIQPLFVILFIPAFYYQRYVKA